MQSRITKLKCCPECGAATDGKSCRCGWVKQGLKATNRNVQQCRVCNAAGDHGGLCKMHWEIQAEYFYKKRQAEYEEALNRKQEKANDEQHILKKGNESSDRDEREWRDEIPF